MKVAIFDIDGVLTKGFVIYDFWNYLAENRIIDKVALAKNKDIFDKFYDGKISYRQMAVNGMKHVAYAFRGAEEREVKKISKKFLLRHKPKLFDYTKPLIKFIRKNKMKIVAVSGSNIEFIENYKRYLRIDTIYGTEFEIADGVYTGSVKLHRGLRENKEKIMKGFHKADKVIGFGDTDQDIPILENVRFPVAINPSNELATIARNREWTILAENDDVIGKVKELVS